MATNSDTKRGLPTVLLVFLVALWLPLVGCGGETADAPEEEVTDAGESAASEASAESISPVRITDLGAVAGPVFSPDGSKIAFLNTRGGLNDRGGPNDPGSHADLYVMNVDGTDLINLTYDLAMSVPYYADPEGRGAQDVRWSSDGTNIAFTSRGRGPERSEIYVTNVDGTDLTNLTNNPAQELLPRFSPDGTKIAFRRGQGKLNIYVMNLDGTDLTRLTDPAVHNGVFEWSPDGTKIAFTSNPVGAWSDIYVMNHDGSDPIDLTNSPSAADTDPTFSPDGSKIAFVSNTVRQGQPNYDIYTMNTDGADPINLTSTLAHGVQPIFSPDGRKVALVSNPTDSNYEIYLVNTDGTDLTNLTNNDSANDVNPAFSPDGKKMAYVSAGYDGSGNYVADLYTMDVSGVD